MSIAFSAPVIASETDGVDDDVEFARLVRRRDPGLG